MSLIFLKFVHVGVWDWRKTHRPIVNFPVLPPPEKMGEGSQKLRPAYETNTYTTYIN